MTTRSSAHSTGAVGQTGPQKLSCLRLRHFSDVPADVAALFAEAERADPQYGLDWFRNLTDTVFPGDTGVCLHVLRIDNAAVAAMALHVTPTTWGHAAKALGNFYTCLYAPAVANSVTPVHLAHLFNDIKLAHAPLASISLAPLETESHLLRLLQQGMDQAGLHTYSHPAFGNWYLPVASSWSEYMAARPGELRSTLKRMSKKFASAAGRFEIVVSPERAAAAIAAYTTVYNTSWKRPEPFAGFMPGLAHACAAHGWLRLGLAWVGDRPVAAQLWIVAGGKANIYKLAYDAEFKHLSPGSLLTAQLMQWVIDEDKVTEIDYMKGDDAYKNQWMTHRRERMGLLGFNPRTVGGLLGLAREATSRLLVAFKLRKRTETKTVQACQVSNVAGPGV